MNKQRLKELIIVSIIMISIGFGLGSYTINTKAASNKIQSTGKLIYNNGKDEVVIDTSEHQLLQERIDNIGSVIEGVTTIVNGNEYTFTANQYIDTGYIDLPPGYRYLIMGHLQYYYADTKVGWVECSFDNVDFQYGDRVTWLTSETKSIHLDPIGYIDCTNKTDITRIKIRGFTNINYTCNLYTKGIKAIVLN